MQNSNSMWKLTALAGAVGLGLLVIMQAKQSLDRTSPKTAEAKGKTEFKDFRPLADLDKLGAPDEFTSHDKPRGNRTTPKGRVSERSEKSTDELSLDELNNSVSDRGRKSARTLAKELDELDLGQSEPTPSRRGKSTAELMLDDPADEPVAASDNNSGSDPFAESQEAPQTARKPSRRAQAQELLQFARKLIDSGLLEEARLKATEADELSVTFGPLEDSPEAVLADIARMETPSRAKADPESESISLAGNADKQSPPLNLDEPDIERVPPTKRKPTASLLADDDNLFADNSPAAPKGVKRIPDPPIPPAEELPGDSSLDLPSLSNDSDTNAKPVKSRPELNSVPSQLKPLATESTELESEKIFGTGTLRSDAPRGPQRPELKIEKVAPPNAVLGKPLVYTIVIRNVGEVAANHVVIEDQIPQGTTLSGTIPRAELSGKSLTWRIGSIAPGETKDIQVKVVPVSEGQVGSVATVSFQAEVASRTNVSAPKIRLRINAPQQVRLGDPATLTFTITNNAAVEATHVVLRSLIPDNLKLEGLTERDLEYDIGTLAPGKTQTVQLPLATVRPGRAINKVIITTDGVPAAEAQAEINVIGQIVSFTRHGPTNSFANKPLDFENRLTNHSVSATQNTVVVESLPKSVEFVSASDGGKFDPSLRTVTWRVSHLDPQQTLPLKIKLLAKTTGNHLGSVQIAESGRKGSATDYQFKTIGAANLSLDFLDKADAYSRGEQFVLRLAVKNKGSGAATNVALRIAVPDELQFVALRGPVNHSQSGRTLVLEPIPEIGGQGTVNIELTFRAVANGDTTLQVEMQSDQFKKPISQEEPLVIFAANVN